MSQALVYAFHAGEVAGAKVLAATILDLLASSDLRQKASAQVEQDTKETKYFSLLPADAKPDLELNRIEMEKYRADMRKHYLSKTPRFN